MMKRVRQVAAALTARIDEADRRFVASRLGEAEQRLFWAMARPDQRHALNVAYTAARLAAGRGDVDQTLLLRCALLHDVGRMRGDAGTADKVMAVLLHKIAPRRARRWGREGRGARLDNARHALYVYFHHAARGAALLTAAGAEPALVEIVAGHHGAPADHDPPELRILRQADDLH